jgi:acyl carrier protein
MGLDIVELVMAVEETFGIEIPDRDAERLRTVGDLYWYVREHTPGALLPIAVAHHSVPSDELWERLLDVIEKETGVDRARLTPAARFVDDLGLD